MRLPRRILLCCLLAPGASLLPAQASKPTDAISRVFTAPIDRIASLTMKSGVPAQSPTGTPAFPARVVEAAMNYLGVPYVHGGDSRQGLDCSGLIYRVFHDTANLDLPRGVEGLFRKATLVRSPMHIGDLVFFDTSDDGSPSIPTHVGLYAGSDRFVHAASEGSRTGVIVSSLTNPYYRDRFLGARRVIKWRPPVLPITLTDDHQAFVEARPFPSREPMTVDIYNGMTGGGPMDLTLLKDGKEVLSRRIVPGAQKPAELSIVPDAGQWIVRICRIFKGRELQRVTFTVME